VGAALLSTSAMAAPKFKLVPLAQPQGSNNSVARAISANGNIAGEGSGGAGANTPLSFGNAAAPVTSVLAAPAGTTNGFIRSINDAGVAAGTAQNSVTVTSQAVLYSTGGFTTLAAGGGLGNAGATGINNGGSAVGYSTSIGFFAAEGTARPISSAQGTMLATVWDSAGVATTLANPFGSFNSLATAINASGQVAGVVNSGAGSSARAVIWTNGVATALDTSGATFSTARAINSNGWVAGRTDQPAAGTFTGAVWNDAGTRFGLAPVGGCLSSDARGINSTGNAVGFGISSAAGNCGGLNPVSGLSAGSVGAFFQWNGAGYDSFAINDLVVNLGGWNLYAPQAINDRGQIVGFGWDELGNTRAFLLTAVPEPASWAMMIAGFGLVGAAARRRRTTTVAA
jgi:uncharacterized membrane protein